MLKEKYEKSISKIESLSNSNMVATECSSLISMLITDTANGEDVSVLDSEASKLSIALTGNIKIEESLELKRFFKVTYTIFNGYVYDRVGKNKVRNAKRVKDILTLLSPIETKRKELDIIPSFDLSTGTILAGGINICETAFRSYTLNKLPFVSNIIIDSENKDIHDFDENGCCKIDGICNADAKYILGNIDDVSKHNIVITLVNVNKLGISEINETDSYFVYISPKLPYDDDSNVFLEELILSDKSRLILDVHEDEDTYENAPYSKICGISYSK